MSNYKGPTEGGSGGKRGHSNMEHWVTSKELKKSSKTQRRINDKIESREGKNTHRNASNQLTIEFSQIDSQQYSKVTKSIVKRFNLKANNNLVSGLDEIFQEFKIGNVIIGLEWDNWAGYIICSKNKDAEPLIKEIAAFVVENYKNT